MCSLFTAVIERRLGPVNSMVDHKKVLLLFLAALNAITLHDHRLLALSKLSLYKCAAARLLILYIHW